MNLVLKLPEIESMYRFTFQDFLKSKVLQI